MDFKPLKVPAVFRLLRPEFREQLKQSSCIQDKAERIIPIRRETENGKKSASVTPERVVPIAVSPDVNSNGSLNNNNSSKTPSERVIPIRRESGDINSTPKRPVGFAPKVNGFNTSPSKTKSSSEDSIEKPEAKPSIVRKLSPLSPKHIVGEKPLPPTKPEHLKSPPMSPEPVSGSPINLSPTPPSSSASLIPEPKVGKPVEPEVTPTLPDSDDSSGRQLESDQNGFSEPRNGEREGQALLLSKDTTVIHNTVINNNHNKTEETFIEEHQGDADYQDNPEEYPEEYFYDNPAPCGLRERELLCPIMEEDNESTASGSIVNLANPSNNGSVIGEWHSYFVYFIQCRGFQFLSKKNFSMSKYFSMTLQKSSQFCSLNVQKSFNGFSQHNMQSTSHPRRCRV